MGRKFIFWGAILILLVFPTISIGADLPFFPSVHIDIGDKNNPSEVSPLIQIAVIFTLLTLIPSILIMVTSFTRIVIVLSFLRQAMGVHTVPPNQVITGLSLFLTLFVMSPIITQINNESFTPYLNKEMKEKEAFDKALVPLRKFMLNQTREKDIALFVDLAKMTRPKDISEVPINIIVPAFMISELKTAFQIGFLLYIPFLVLDMVVASVLMSMGMMLFPPVMISLPFKLMLFVLADGWNLVIGSLIKTFQ